MKKLRDEKGDRVLCGYCKINLAHYGKRGLCLRCYKDEGIRHTFGSDNRKGVAFNLCGGYKHPSEPTDAVPGSKEKMEILQQRASLGVSLWHPLDNTEQGGSQRYDEAEAEDEADAC